MAFKTALNGANLEALGGARLAGLLMELSEGDGAAQRRLRLELAAGQGPGEVARAVRRRLGQVARARGYVDWYRRRPVIEDLDAHRRAILEGVAPGDPAEALELTWRLLALAGPVHERCDDGDGLVGDLFRAALADLGEVAAAARPDPEGLADHAVGALQDNGYAQYDGLVAALAPALGERGLRHLEDRLRVWAALPTGAPDGDDGTAARTGPDADPDDAAPSERALRERRGAARIALSDIADARGDADGFAAQFDARARRAPTIAAAIAQRLLAAGRAGEALAALDGAEVSRWLEPPPEWHDARLEALDALGRGAEAQAVRWARFEAALSEGDLRAHLARLPDFEDVEAEERAPASSHGAAGPPEGAPHPNGPGARTRSTLDRGSPAPLAPRGGHRDADRVDADPAPSAVARRRAPPRGERSAPSQPRPDATEHGCPGARGDLTAPSDLRASVCPSGNHPVRPPIVPGEWGTAPK